MRFLRDNRYDLVRPEVLGLPSTTGRTAWVLDRAEAGFREALLAGDEDQARQIIFDLYLAKLELVTILDEVVASTFHRIGDLWSCGARKCTRSGEVVRSAPGCCTNCEC